MSTKIFIKKEIYRKYFPGEYATIRMKDIPEDVLPDDVIEIERTEDYHSENNSYDAHTSLVISRMIEETDEEFEKRMIEVEKAKERMKKMRKERYLKLKEEFEP